MVTTIEYTTNMLLSLNVHLVEALLLNIQGNEIVQIVYTNKFVTIFVFLNIFKGVGPPHLN